MGDLLPPLVSVVIPTHHRPGLLVRAMESVALQTYPNVELIIVNDILHDESEIKAKEFIKKHPALHGIYLHGEGGASNSRNAGVKISHGEYVVFLDDDDLLFPDFIKEVFHVLDGVDRSYAAASSDYIMTDSSGRRTYEIANFDGAFGPLARSTMFRKEIFLKDNIWYDPSLCSVEDLDFGMRFFSKYKAISVHKPLNEYFLRAPSLGDNESFLSGNYQRNYENFILILNRYTPQIAKAKDLNIFFEIQAGHLAAKAGKMRSARKHLSRALSSVVVRCDA